MTKNGEYVNRRSYHRKRNNDRRIVRKPLLQHSLSLPLDGALRGLDDALKEYILVKTLF